MDNTIERKGFTFYASFDEAIRTLTDETDQLKMYKAICDYALRGETSIVLEDAALGIWISIKPIMDTQLARSRANLARKTLSGGAPVGNTNAAKEENNNKTTTKQQQNNNKTTTSNRDRDSNRYSNRPKGKEENTIKEDSSNLPSCVVGCDSPIIVTEEEQKFNNWVSNFTNVQGMDMPLTYEQYCKLLEKGYSHDEIQSKMIAMENYKQLRKKNKSAYLTLLDWLKNHPDKR